METETSPKAGERTQVNDDTPGRFCLELSLNEAGALGYALMKAQRELKGKTDYPSKDLRDRLLRCNDRLDAAIEGAGN